MNTLRLLLCVIIITPQSVFGKPTCTPNEKKPSIVTCTHGDTDYVLERGLVSDNNRTVKITLRGCRITVLGYEAFHGLPLVKHIDLSSNKLSEIRLGTMDATQQLTHLNLSYNSLSKIPMGLFDKKTNLVSLDLKGNKISTLEVGVFDPLWKLQYLDLSSNPFFGNQLSADIFRRNSRITFMDFSRNDMTETHEDLLQTFQMIEFLNLDRCDLTEVPNFAIRKNLNTMKKILLSVNQISKLDNPTTFANIESLELLNIGWNVIKTVHEDVFKPLKNLKIIVLRNNRLTSIPDKLFQNMRTLSNIDISNNHITFVPVNAFRGTGVKNLNLANNDFTYLTDNFCLELRNTGVRLQKFFFHQNPWQCVCLLDIVKEVEKFNIEYNTAKYDGAQPVCVSDQYACHRHDNFNEIYVDLYKVLVLKNSP